MIMEETNHLTGLRGLNISFQDLAFGQKHALSAWTKYFESDATLRARWVRGRAANSELIAALISSSKHPAVGVPSCFSM